MPFSAPPDNSKAILAVAIGLSLSVIVFALTRNNLPGVGDNLHNLPHGGLYADGTKKISYFAPQGRIPSSNLLRNSGNPFIVCVIVALILAIYLSEKGFKICARCGNANCPNGRTQ